MLKKEPMVKVVGLLRRNPKISPQEFQDYWKNVHAPLVKEKLPGLVHYTGSFPIPGAKAMPGVVTPDYDGVVELCFDSVESAQKALNGPLFSQPDREKSSNSLIDIVRSESMMMEEYVVQLK